MGTKTKVSDLFGLGRIFNTLAVLVVLVGGFLFFWGFFSQQGADKSQFEKGSLQPVAMAAGRNWIEYGVDYPRALGRELGREQTLQQLAELERAGKSEAEAVKILVYGTPTPTPTPEPTPASKESTGCEEPQEPKRFMFISLPNPFRVEQCEPAVAPTGQTPTPEPTPTPVVEVREVVRYVERPQGKHPTSYPAVWVGAVLLIAAGSVYVFLEYRRLQGKILVDKAELDKLQVELASSVETQRDRNREEALENEKALNSALARIADLEAELEKSDLYGVRLNRRFSEWYYEHSKECPILREKA